MVFHTLPAKKAPAWTQTLPHSNLGGPLPGACIVGQDVSWQDDITHIEDLLVPGRDEVRLTFGNGSLATVPNEDARFVRLFFEKSETVLN